MSYTIMYDRQFIRSAKGFTPAILAGSNNVWGGMWSSNRRARSWSVFGNKLAQTDQELLSMAESMTGSPYQEHWMQNGKWVDDAGLICWMINGIKNAATMEEIIAVNPFQSVNCKLHIWESTTLWPEELPCRVKTNEEFDLWVEQANARIAELNDKKNVTIYPIVEFSFEDKIYHPKNKPMPAQVLVKQGKRYLVEVGYRDNGVVYSTHWSVNVKDANVFSASEATALLKMQGQRILGRIKFVNASLKDAPHNAVIAIFEKDKNGDEQLLQYVYSTGKTARVVSSLGSAKRYPDKKAAQRAVKSVQSKIENINRYAKVVVLDEN